MRPAEPLVGRRAELEVLDHALGRAAAGRPVVMEIVGEPGIGKTRLLAELGSRADGAGHLVLTGSASELEADLPYWVFVDALEEYVGGLEPQRLAALDQEAQAELPHVFPALPGSREEAPPDLKDERYRTHHAVRALLQLLAAGRPLVVTLDDLHWADPGSIDLLAALLRRPPAAPVLLALAMRPRQVPERLNAALARRRTAEDFMSIELHRLCEADAARLLGGRIDQEEARTLYAQSGGNPFYLEQLARATRSGLTLTAMTTGAGPAASDPVAAALAGELVALDRTLRRLLEGAAVAGDPFDLDVAAAAAELDEARVAEALDGLLARDLVRHTDLPRRFRFRHPLVRAAVYDGTPRGWQLGAHERSARLLARQGAPVAERVHHVERSARHGDPDAVALLRDAGTAAAWRAPATAARWLEAALRILPSSAPASERLDLLLTLAGAHATAGQLQDAHAAMLAALDLVPPEGLDLRVRIVADCARIEHALGLHGDAHRRLVAALDAVSDERSAAAVALMIELAFDGIFERRFDAMRGWGARARIAASALGERSLGAAAAGIEALAAALAGDIGDARSARAEAAELIAGLHDEELGWRLDAAINVAAAELYLDEFRAAAAHAERALAIGRALGQRQVFPLAYPIIASSMMLLGRLREAAELLDTAVEAARLTGNDETLAWGLMSRASVAGLAADAVLELAQTAEATRLLEGKEGTLLCALAAYEHARALLATGEPRPALLALSPAACGQELEFLPPTTRAGAFELVARCHLALGRLDDARRARSAPRSGRGSPPREPSRTRRGRS